MIFEKSNCVLFIRQTLVAMAAALLASSPCLGDSVNGTLKSTISKSINLPPLDDDFSPGRSFDRTVALNRLTNPVGDDEWSKIPHSVAELWVGISSLKPFRIDTKNTTEGDKLHIPILAFSVEPPMLCHTGNYTDATGQIWGYIIPPHWREKNDGRFQHHILVIEQPTTESSDKVYSSAAKRIEFIVDPGTNKIVRVLRHMSEETWYLLEPDPISNRHNSRTETVRETFDEHGDLLQTRKSEIYRQSQGTIIADTSITLPDGRNLFEMFKNYLKLNGMADRIPKVEHSAKPRYLSPGQVDYSRQKHGYPQNSYEFHVMLEKLVEQQLKGYPNPRKRHKQPACIQPPSGAAQE